MSHTVALNVSCRSPWSGVVGASPGGVDVPVVFVSGYTNDPAPLEGPRGARAEFLRKPFTARELGAAVQRALQAEEEGPVRARG